MRACRAAIALLTAMAVAGCTAPGPQQPGPVPGVTGTDAPQTGQSQPGTGLIPPDSVTGTAPPGVSSTGPTGSPPPPEVATLAWLSGASTAHGIIVPARDGKRWQGTVPGSYALLGDHGYSWFGPDGSMVGCTDGGSCVGVDGDGHIAVTTSRTAPRLVYDPNGHFVGRFAADGDRMSSPSHPPALTHTLSGSGVDLSGLVNSATLGAPFAGGVTGDPHLITAGGVRFTTQSAGQFVARGGDGEHAIQVEFEPMAHREDVSVVSAVAIGAGKDTVIVDMDGAVDVNGSVMARRSGFDQVTLPSGVAVGRWPADSNRVIPVAVVWPDGSSVVMAANPALGMTVVAHLVPKSSAVGLFGAGKQGAGPDLVARDGTSGSTGHVVSSWRVTGAERLFASAPAPTPGFSEKAATLQSGAEKVAEQACGSQGLRDAEDVAACSFDVALTGDTGFVAGHVDLDVPAEHDPVAASLAKRWPALLPGSVAGATDLPSDGRLRFSLASRKSRTFRIKLDHGGDISLVNGTGCATGETPPGMDRPAMRVFDSSGHAVSDRLALCGHEQTPTLPAGVYDLVIVNGPSPSSLSVRVDVTLP